LRAKARSRCATARCAGQRTENSDEHTEISDEEWVIAVKHKEICDENPEISDEDWVIAVKFFRELGVWADNGPLMVIRLRRYPTALRCRERAPSTTSKPAARGATNER
jgi:hypothetical protein